jgi:hypothetical protein
MFLVSFVIAQGKIVEQELKTNIKTQQKLIDRNYIGENGQQIKIQEKENNQRRLKVNNVSVDCHLNLIQKQIKNKTKLEIKQN